jgi:hypothetical protein
MYLLNKGENGCFEAAWPPNTHPALFIEINLKN